MARPSPEPPVARLRLSWLWLEHHGERTFLTGLMGSQYGYELNAPDYAMLLEQPGLPPARILPVLRRQFQPDGHVVPDVQILAAMGLTSASSRKASPSPACALATRPVSTSGISVTLPVAHGFPPLYTPAGGQTGRPASAQFPGAWVYPPVTHDDAHQYFGG